LIINQKHGNAVTRENPHSADCRYSAVKSLNQNQPAALPRLSLPYETSLYCALILSIALGYSKDVLLRMSSSVASYSIVPKVLGVLEMSDTEVRFLLQIDTIYQQSLNIGIP
jgi:hypothetical protein